MCYFKEGDHTNRAPINAPQSSCVGRIANPPILELTGTNQNRIKRNTLLVSFALKAIKVKQNEKSRISGSNKTSSIHGFNATSTEHKQPPNKNIHPIANVCGQVVEPDGTITTITDPYEGRMAAKVIFNKWIDVLAMLQEGLDDETGEVKITEIILHKSGNGASKKDGGVPLTTDSNDLIPGDTSPPKRRSRRKKTIH